MSTPVKYSPDAIEIELIRSLYDGLLPSLVMSVGFILCGALIIEQSGDLLITGPYAVGVLASITRLLIAWRDALSAGKPAITLGEARRLERRYAASYIVFAAMLGFFAARGLALPDPAIDKLAICLVIGYAAGVAAGTSLRPRIAVASLLLAVMPPVVTMLSAGKPLHIATALMTAAFLVGGIFSLRKRHARALDDIGRRLTFASLARSDGLTDLPNRLALREWFDRNVRDAKLRPIALHCLDLNGFKLVNDSFGHPVGDELLTAVAKRISGTLREGDIAARLGGDEFVIVQLQIDNSDEAYMLAERIAASIARPFAIGSHDVRVSTSIGYIVCDDLSRDLEQLISLADEALYTAKRSGRSICRYQDAAKVRAAA